MLAKAALLYQADVQGHWQAQVPVLPLILLRLLRRPEHPGRGQHHSQGSHCVPIARLEADW